MHWPKQSLCYSLHHSFSKTSDTEVTRTGGNPYLLGNQTHDQIYVNILQNIISHLSFITFKEPGTWLSALHGLSQYTLI